MHEINITRANREETRWRILRALDAARPVAISDAIIWRTLSDINLSATPAELRRELIYLEGVRLLRIGSRDQPTWTAELTSAGIDVVEYTVPCPPGIGRPPNVIA